MAPAIKDLRVRSLDVDIKEVSWRFEAGQEDVLDYGLVVLRSESPEGPFEAVSPQFRDRYLFVDRRLPHGDKFRKLYYKIRIIKLLDSTTTESEIAAQQPDPDLVANYIRRSEMTLFTQAIGRQVWLFKRRTFGPRCAGCWNSTLHKKVREMCLACFDTGFLRGYHNPIEVWMQIDPAGKAQQNNPQQMAQQTFTSARMSFYPEVSPGDLVVEAENRRWHVQKVQQSERLRAVIKQELQMHEIQSTDIEYRLPINLTEAIRDIQPSPARMFENATDLSSAVSNRAPVVHAAYPTLPRDTEE